MTSPTSCQHGRSQTNEGNNNRAVVVRVVVRGQLQQQCRRQDVTQRISISHDHDNGPIVLYSRAKRAPVQSVGRPEVCGHILALLHACHRATCIRQVRRLRFLACQHMEGARFLCTHRYHFHFIRLCLLVVGPLNFRLP